MKANPYSAARRAHNIPAPRGCGDGVRLRRRTLALSIAITAAALAIAAYGAEVDPHTFWSKLGNFTSYFNRLLTL